MTMQKSLVYRVGVGKALGLVIGLLGFFLLPVFVHDTTLYFRTGILFWYVSLGAIIGVFGIFNRHPVLSIPMPWWVRGAIIGAWFNLVLTLIAYEQICTMSMAIFGEYSVYLSPFWMVLEGAIIGLLMDYLLSRWFGEYEESAA